MKRSRTPLLTLTRQSYSDLGRILAALWPELLIACILTVAAQFTDLLLQTILQLPPTGRHAVTMLMNLVALALVTPFIVAVHRFVLLQEVPSGYWSVHRASILLVMPILLMFEFCNGLTPILTTWGAGGATAFGVSIAAFVLSLRLIILVPALVVQAPGATPPNALDDTRGHGWYIFGAIMLPMIPFVVIGLAIFMATGSTTEMKSPWFIAAKGLLMAFQLPLGIIVISRLYQMLGDRVEPTAARHVDRLPPVARRSRR